MREQIKFGLIRTQEEFDALSQFAASFDHQVNGQSILPIYTIERGKQMVGYFNVICIPIVCPSFHPDVCTPRDIHEIVQMAKNHFCMNSISDRFPNGTCMLAMPKNLPDNKRAIAERCGFKSTKAELWQAIP